MKSCRDFIKLLAAQPFTCRVCCKPSTTLRKYGDAKAPVRDRCLDRWRRAGRLVHSLAAGSARTTMYAHRKEPYHHCSSEDGVHEQPNGGDLSVGRFGSHPEATCRSRE